MKIRVAITKILEVETEGGDTEDWNSVNSHVLHVQNMPIEQLEKEGKVINSNVEFVDVVGPADEE